jgi:hypothetical protein
VKGFRPGKAPLKVVESIVGAEALRKEAIDDALPGVLTTALEEADLMPAVPPRLTEVRDGGETVEVDLLVTLWPTLAEVPEYRHGEVDPRGHRFRRHQSSRADAPAIFCRRCLLRASTVISSCRCSPPPRRADYAAGSAKAMLFEIGSGAFLEDGRGIAVAGSIVAFIPRCPTDCSGVAGQKVRA